MRFILITGILMLFCILYLSAEENTFDATVPIKSSLSADKIEGKPKVFIEGRVPDAVYMRKSINFVDFVNDPKVADVHIIITRRQTGGGGRMYSLMYYNVTFPNMSDYTLSCNTLSGDTESEIRELVVNTIKMGLMPFINQSEIADNFSIRYKERGKQNTIEVVNDPWNSWTIKGDLSGSLDWEETKKITNSFYSLKIDRVTEDWRIRNSGRIANKYSDITKGDGSHRMDTISSSFLSSSVVNSLTERWSAGAFVSIYNGTVRNTYYSVTFKPAIEYNIFPWDVSDRKVLTLAYYIGPEWSNWYDLTQLGKLKEWHWEEALRLDFKLVKTWGEMDARLSATNFIDEFDKYEVSLDAGASIRIVRGLSFRFNFGMSSIHNQIYLRKREATDEEVLLGTVKLPTTFDINANLGLRIQFGSIYNNVINNRL